MIIRMLTRKKMKTEGENEVDDDVILKPNTVNCYYFL